MKSTLAVFHFVRLIAEHTHSATVDPDLLRGGGCGVEVKALLVHIESREVRGRVACGILSFLADVEASLGSLDSLIVDPRSRVDDNQTELVVCSNLLGFRGSGKSSGRGGEEGDVLDLHLDWSRELNLLLLFLSVVEGVFCC